MTDMSTGVRAPDSSESRVQQTTEAAGQAAADIKDTAKDQARRVADEASRQARNTAAELRERAGTQARNQNDKLVGGIRRMADELDQMRAERQEGPAAAVVSRVADGGRQMADYLERNGPDGVLREVQDFARRRPGAFLATALAAGFVVGRLGKGVMKADEASTGKPATDAFVSDQTAYPSTTTYPSSEAGTYVPPATTSPYATPTEPTGYPASTEYAATGTGTPVAVDPPYGDDLGEGRLR